MFKNVGGKIKSLTKVVFWIGSIASVISGIALTTSGIRAGIALFFIGPLFFWISSLGMYGFGQLIENTDKLVAMQINDTEIGNIDSEYDEKIAALLSLRKQGAITDKEYLEKVREVRNKK